MTGWLVAAAALAVLVLPCAAVCFFAGPLSGLASMQVAGGLTTGILLLLTQAFQRQPFADLALVFAALTVIGGIVFARLMEHDL